MDDFECHYDHLMQSAPEFAKSIARRIRDQQFMLADCDYPRGPDDRQPLLGVLSNFAIAGYQAYLVGPVLQHMFGNTASGTIPKDLFRLPHHTFYVAFPSSSLSLACDDRVVPVKGAYVTVNGDMLVVVVCAFDHVATDEVVVYLSLRGRSVDGVVVLDLEQDLSTTTDFDGSPANPVVVGCLQQVMRLTVNMIRYLHCERREVVVSGDRPARMPSGMPKSSKKAAKAARRFMKPSQIRVTRIAPTIEQSGVGGWVGLGGTKAPHMRAGFYSIRWHGPRFDRATGIRIGQVAVQTWIHPTVVNAVRLPPADLSARRIYEFAMQPTP